MYCRARWRCEEECPLDGPSACAECRERLLDADEEPARLIAVPLDAAMLQRLIQAEVTRFRREIFRKRE
ncbi:MAG: hypothetical protein HY294_03080 [Candidatus Rokubacteria bacterium]|nr:hypothetical protein [Candidatus Rokubacteria bacterium]